MTIDLERERQWIASISRKAPAQPLLRHFAALDAIVRGNLKTPEPPAQQASVWRRLFVHAYSKSDAPFGMKSESGNLPKCVAICNLSGQYVIYHTDSFSLARIVCLTPQLKDEESSPVSRQSSPRPRRWEPVLVTLFFRLRVP